MTQALTFVCDLSCAIYNGMEKMKWQKPKTEKKNLRFQKYPAALCGILNAYWLIEACVNGINARFLRIIFKKSFELYNSLLFALSLF